MKGASALLNEIIFGSFEEADTQTLAPIFGSSVTALGLL